MVTRTISWNAVLLDTKGFPLEGPVSYNVKIADWSTGTLRGQVTQLSNSADFNAVFNVSGSPVVGNQYTITVKAVDATVGAGAAQSITYSYTAEPAPAGITGLALTEIFS